MNNKRIKEAWDKWIEIPESEAEAKFIEQFDFQLEPNMPLGFHGGYTAADREWREKVEKLRDSYRNCSLQNVDAQQVADYIDRILGSDSSNKG